MCTLYIDSALHCEFSTLPAVDKPGDVLRPAQYNSSGDFSSVLDLREPPVALATSARCFSPRLSPVTSVAASSLAAVFPAPKGADHCLFPLSVWQTRGKKWHRVHGLDPSISIL